MNKNFRKNNQDRGFTLIEVIIVAVIISILATIVLTGANSFRENARDVKRISDLENIALALQVYREKNGEYPCEIVSNCSNQSTGEEANGIIGEGAGVDALLNSIIILPQDPLGPNNAIYRYYYDGRQSCGGNPNQVVIAAIEMEKTANENVNDTVCASFGGEGGIGSSNSYNIVIGPSTDG